MPDPKGLGWDRDRDPQLYDLYARKLLQRGWAGVRSQEEKAYCSRVYAERQGAGNSAPNTSGQRRSGDSREKSWRR